MNDQLDGSAARVTVTDQLQTVREKQCFCRLHHAFVITQMRAGQIHGTEVPRSTADSTAMHARIFETRQFIDIFAEQSFAKGLPGLETDYAHATACALNG